MKVLRAISRVGVFALMCLSSVGGTVAAMPIELVERDPSVDISDLRGNVIFTSVHVRADTRSLDERIRLDDFRDRVQARADAYSLSLLPSIVEIAPVTRETLLAKITEKYESSDPDDMLAIRIRRLGKTPHITVRQCNRICFNPDVERRKEYLSALRELTGKDYVLNLRFVFSSDGLKADSSAEEIPLGTASLVICDTESGKRVLETSVQVSKLPEDTTSVVEKGLGAILEDFAERVAISGG